MTIEMLGFRGIRALALWNKTVSRGSHCLKKSHIHLLGFIRRLFGGNPSCASAEVALFPFPFTRKNRIKHFKRSFVCKIQLFVSDAILYFWESRKNYLFNWKQKLLPGPVKVNQPRYFPMKLARPESNEKRLFHGFMTSPWCRCSLRPSSWRGFR